MDTHYHYGTWVCGGRRLHPDDGVGCYTHAELDAWGAAYEAAHARPDASEEEREEQALAEAEGEAYAEFGSSWVHGGGRVEDVRAAWAAHRRR
jgi:hypothetical protein